jgi:hypothetical protein
MSVNRSRSQNSEPELDSTSALDNTLLLALVLLYSKMLNLGLKSCS